MVNRLRRTGGIARAVVIALLAVVPGCSRHLGGLLVPNLPPELEILDARADRMNPADVRVRWAARDPDGSVARSCWTLAPMRPGAARGEVASTRAEACVLGGRTPLGARAAGTARPEPDLFTVWAVDNRGAESERATVAMFGNNIAPTVQITCPRISDLVATQTGPTVRIYWAGNDPDGVSSQKPVKYKWKLFSQGNPEFDFNLARSFPDSVRRFYAANGWAGWDSLGGDSTSVALPAEGSAALQLFHDYLFVVVAFDEVGDYSPVFSLNGNMLWFTPGSAQNLGPVLSVWNTNFFYRAVSGGWFTDPAFAVNVEVPWGVPLAFNVSGATPMTGYRWALDSLDPHDRTVRSTPTDLRHWSAWSLDPLITLDLPARQGFKREEHTLYIEGRGQLAGCAGTLSEEFLSLVMIHFVVVRPTYSRELLIVDDTRREVDQYTVTGAVKPYTQVWPAAAELDTFLYAHGGVPWRGTQVPATTVPQPVSSPGLFAGYSFDTVGTRGLLTGVASSNGYQSGTVPLSLLADYRHVVWMTDPTSATNPGVQYDPVRPMSALRYMSMPNHESVLAAYAAMGGKVWLLGGSAAYASLIEYNARNALNNDSKYGPGMTVFSNDAGELVPGRLMYDMAHARSELVNMTVSTTATSVSRALGRFQGNPGPYAMLPAVFRTKLLARGDTLPPTRTLPTQFYSVSSRSTEFLTQPNGILEDASPDPNFPDPQSVLDSLYVVTGLSLPATGNSAVSMTLYHGRENGQFLWSGFDIWSFTRADCQQLVDGVLQGVWSLPRAPVAAWSMAGSGGAIAPGASRHLPSPASRRR
jgi:hypothetical protein